MEYIIVAVILYFILQTASNLILILRGKGEGSLSQSSGFPEHEWKGPSPRQETGAAVGDPTFWSEDIEEARWQDLES